MTRYYCVPASEQLMGNMVKGTDDVSRATQDRLYAETRSYLIAPYSGRGSQPEGWARVLTDEGDGAYDVVVMPTFGEAVALAARRLRTTGRPVGLLVWGGIHAWVMSGFRSLSDPAATNDFTVEGIYVEDPWWPRVSRIHGASNLPDTFVPTADLAQSFLPYVQTDEGGINKSGQYVLILPEG